MAKKILIVDDDENTKLLIKTLLMDEGYSITTAKDGKEALSKLKIEKFNLVLIDFYIPGMNGRELAEAIIDDPKTKNTKFAFLTVATFSKKEEKELQKLGSLNIIKEPIDNEDFKKMIERMI